MLFGFVVVVVLVVVVVVFFLLLLFLVILVHVAISMLTHGMFRERICLVRTRCFSYFHLVVILYCRGFVCSEGVLLQMLYLWGNDT